MRLLHSLQTKLTLSFIALVLIVSSATFFYSHGETKKALKEIVRTELTAVSALVAADLSGDDADVMESLQPGEEDSDEFLRLQNRLKSLRASHPDFKYLYTMRKVGKDLCFIVDPDYGNEKDPGASIGEVYKEVTDAMLVGLERPVAEEEFSTDKWGTVMSGFAPVRNSRGQIVGMVGLDMSSDLVIAKQTYLGRTIFVIIGVGIVAAALFILAFSKTIIKDVNTLNAVANQISMGDTAVQLRVRRKDEIGDLAESFGRMVASLKIMMMTDRQ